MNAEQAIAMMNRCETEIMTLRATVDRLAPKADAYDNIAQLLAMTRGHGGGMSSSEDVLWVIKAERQRLEREIAESKARTDSDIEAMDALKKPFPAYTVNDLARATNVSSKEHGR